MDKNLFITVIILVLLVAMLIAIAHFSKPRLNKKYYQEHWQKIETEKNDALAIIAADKLVDHALIHAHIRGKTMGERLKKSTGLIKDINGVWYSHKLRNSLVHEPDFKINFAIRKRALLNFKKALKDLGAL